MNPVPRRTVIVNVLVTELPAASRAVHVTVVVVPTANREPEPGEQRAASVPSRSSLALGWLKYTWIDPLFCEVRIVGLGGCVIVGLVVSGLISPPRSKVYDTDSACVEDLKNGQVDAVTTDEAILIGYAAQDPDNLKVVGDVFSEERYGVGIAKGDTAFQEFINKTFTDGGEIWTAIFDKRSLAVR